MFDNLFYPSLKKSKVSPNPTLKNIKYIKCLNALWHNKYLKYYLNLI